MDTITITAQQAAERLLTMKRGFALLIIIAVLFLIWLIQTNRSAERASIERSKAMKLRVHDQNKAERENWIATNCDLHAQNEQLRAEVERLTKENERLRSVMARVKVAEL